MTPLELELRFERGSTPGSYRVVARGPGGAAASGRFADPFSDLQLENFVLRMGRRSGVRRVESPESQLAKEFGTRLFGAVFDNEDVREAYRSSLQEARHTRSALRITLTLTGTPELLRLPWEYLYDEPDFLAISRWTPIVRRLDVGTPRPPLELTLPIRILGVVSAPSDAEPIDAGRERARLTTALGPLVKADAVSIDWVEQATLLGLTRMLDDHDYHVLHFIGHGGYEESVEDGVLLFEDEEGRSNRVSGEQLGQILRDQLTMRLVVLNACEGARSSADDPFSGVAARLIRHGIPSVIGMQFEITDRAAILFAADFYAAIANGRPVDAAMARARRMIYADHNLLEWGTPVLFMRVHDGRLFEVAPHEPIEAPSHDALLETAVHVGLMVADEEADAAAAPTPEPSGGASAPVAESPAPMRTARAEDRAAPQPQPLTREQQPLTREQRSLERLANPHIPQDREAQRRAPGELTQPRRRPGYRPRPEDRRRRGNVLPFALVGIVLAGIVAVVLAIAVLDGDGDGDTANTGGGGGEGGGATAQPTAVALVSMPNVFARPLQEALDAARQAGFTGEPRVEHVCSRTLEGRPGLVREVLIDVGAPDGVASDAANRLVGSPNDTLRSQLQVRPDTPLHVKVATGEAC